METKTSAVSEPAMTPMQRFNRQIHGVNAQAYLEQVLGEKKTEFVSNLVTVVANNEALQTCDPMSIVYAALTATSLSLPLNPNLGCAALIPYNDKKSGKTLCQFQIMRDGWVELCHRTGQVISIANEEVHEGELIKKNKFTGEYIFDEDARKSDKIIGYMAYIKLVNGYEKTVYWTKEEVEAHAKQYSQVYKKGFGLWVDNPKAMALKTVLKHLIKKYMPKSVSLQKAILTDQAAINKDGVPTYVDAPDEQEQHEAVVADKKEQLRSRESSAPELL